MPTGLKPQPHRLFFSALLIVVLGTTGCTTPEAVREFTASATEAAAQFPPLVRDMTESCIRKQLADRPLNEIADVNQQVTDACKEFSDLEPNLMGALRVFTQYLNALNQLASDSAVSYDTEIDGFARKLQAATKFKEPEVKAIKGLAKFLFDAAASGYQRQKLGSAIKAADADVATLTAALGTIIGADYERVLRTEQESVRTRYREAVAADRNMGTLLLI